MNAIVESIKNKVEFPDGETKVFSQKGRLFTTSETSENSIKVKAYLANGQLLDFSLPVETPEQIEFVKILAGRAMEELVKSSVTGINIFEIPDDLPENSEIPDTIPSVISAKFEDFANLRYNSRNTGSGTVEPLSLIERAYAMFNKLDITNPEVYRQIQDWSSNLTKEDKIAIKTAGKSELWPYYMAASRQQKEEREAEQLKLHEKVFGSVSI